MDDDDLPDLSLWDKAACIVGDYLIRIGTFFIRPGCRLLCMAPINNDRMWILLNRYTSERTHSRFGLEGTLSFHQYISEGDERFPSRCYVCMFSKDQDEFRVLCRHPDTYPAFRQTAIPIDGPVPEDCPIRLRLKRLDDERVGNGD